MDNNAVPMLLVEDEPDLREALGEYFEACGFAVTSVATAAEALTAAVRLKPSLLLTDLSLPDRRGDSFLAEFHLAFPACLLYVHSGDSSFVPTPELVACGLTRDHVMSKPADLGEMVAKFRTDLSIKR
jgi:DNA-binding response OmpR family regulator